MKKNLFKFSLLVCFLFSFSSSFSQYIVNGNAQQYTCNCYVLTQPAVTQAGSVWNANKISLNNSFDFTFNVYLGCLNDNGADGIVFILQPISTSIGSTGQGLGFEGISPSIGISLDTWQNPNQNDPAYDHISIQANGVILHGNDLAGPIPIAAASDNVEDCQWHTFRITWDASTDMLSTYFDGTFRLQVQDDLVTNIFSGNPMVYWGFSGATGGSYNLQQFCTILQSEFSTNFTDNATCIGTPVIFQDHSQSFSTIQSYFWDFGDNSTSTVANPPPHNYATPGNYIVKHVIVGMDGCASDTVKKTVVIAAMPIASFEVFDTCTNTDPRIADHSLAGTGTISNWQWWLDGNSLPASQTPQTGTLPVGPHQLELVVTNNYGCISGRTTKNFTVNERPKISASTADGCANTLINFTALQLDNNTIINSWNWNFEPGQTASTQSASHSFATPGNKDVSLYAIASNGCSSDTLLTPVMINALQLHATNDTTIILNQPFQLTAGATYSGSAQLNYNWSPTIGLNDPASATPVTILQDDQVYYLTVRSADGCVAKDTINLTVFKGSNIFVPSGFTPNRDGKNDLLHPGYYGIKQLNYFTIYNRWGQQVFTTKSLSAGWDGRFQGQNQEGTFVWILSATDFVGKKYSLKGTTTIVR